MAEREVWDYSAGRWLDWDDLQHEIARSVVRPRQPTEADIEAVSAWLGKWMIEDRSGMKFPANRIAGERFEATARDAGFSGQTRDITVTYWRCDEDA